MNEHLATLTRYLNGDKTIPLSEAFDAYFSLKKEAVSKYKDQTNKPNKMWLKEAHAYQWTDKKYAHRLEALFKENDETSTAFPWWEVLKILFSLLRLLLSRA